MQTNRNSTRRSLLVSATALILSIAMLVGTTFAWFTDSASTGVNKIQAGNLDVALEMSTDGTSWESAEGKTLQFKKAAGAAQRETVLWEPGCTYELPQLRVVNKGNLALKYKIQITGIQGDAKLNEVIDWTIDGITLGNTFTSLAVGESSEFTIKGHMQETASNEYQGLSINGIGITVFATQDTVENDSNGNQYDEDAGTAHYTLAEFNALTEIPEDVKVVYLNIGDVSLKDGSVTVGNKSMADVYTSVTGDYYVGQKLDDGRVVSSVWNADGKIYLANTNKAGITLYVSGSVNENNDYGLNNEGSGPFPNSLNFVIPDASNIVFTKDFTVNGFFRCGFSWDDNTNLGGGVAGHKIQSVLFDHSTFNGIWIQNGGFNTNSVTLDGCTFNAYENTKFANDSNPLWFCNIRTCDVTVKNCTFKASRPIKVVEQGVYGANVTITGNTFDMSLPNSVNDRNKPKNDAIMFSTLIGESQSNPAGTLGNVVVSGNKVTGANALLTFIKPSQITMANGATFTVSQNTLNGAKLSVEWKKTTEYKPDFVKFVNPDVAYVAVSAPTAEDIATGVNPLANALISASTEAGISGEAKDKIAADLAAGTFKLTDKEGSVKGAVNGKEVTLNGAGADKTTYEVKKAGASGEGAADYSFDGAKAVVFKNMTVEFGLNTDFQGFVRAGAVRFENCTIKGMGAYWGVGDVVFDNCNFVFPEGGNEYTYNLWTYGGSSFTFNKCTFTSDIGKFINVYRQDNDGVVVDVTLNDCTFINKVASANKAAVKINGDHAWNVTINNCTKQGVFPTENSGLWEIQNAVAGNKITVDGVLAYSK